MAKRSKGKAKDTQPIESNAGALSHNPLAGLAALRGAVPGAAPMAAPPTPMAAPTPVKRSAAPAKKQTPPAPGPSAKKPPVVIASSSATPPRFTCKLVVRRENKGRAGKTVTRISGLPRAELDALAKELKKALGCGATVEGEDLLLLGSLVDRAAAWFEKVGVSRLVKGN